MNVHHDPAGESLPPIPPDGDPSAPEEPGFTEPRADRPPTADEEAVAERVSKDVDVDEVGANYDDAMRTGAQIKGEGEVET